jgi:hypothetical protein
MHGEGPLRRGVDATSFEHVAGFAVGFVAADALTLRRGSLALAVQSA